jgi:hypothetical protein
LFEHCVEPGTHTPVQALFTQADDVQATPVPHCPAAVHV